MSRFGKQPGNRKSVIVFGRPVSVQLLWIAGTVCVFMVLAVLLFVRPDSSDYGNLDEMKALYPELNDSL